LHEDRCPRCDGEGKVPDLIWGERKCVNCEGTGLILVDDVPEEFEEIDDEDDEVEVLPLPPPPPPPGPVNTRALAAIMVGSVIFAFVLIYATQSASIPQPQLQLKPCEPPNIEPSGSSSPFVVEFGVSQPTYPLLKNHERIVVIGNNAYTMGDASDSYAASHNIPLVGCPTNQSSYVKAHGLNLVCCDDQAMAILQNYYNNQNQKNPPARLTP
jgi:hypothetical protein